MYWTTAYLVDGLMIDSGCAHTSKELCEYLSGQEITQIVNTHSHEDHIGANAGLQEDHPDVVISAHPLALQVLTEPEKHQPLHPYRSITWGMPSPSIAQPVENGAIIDTGIFHFQVIYTPGHSQDHLCLYEPDQRWAFTGDLFVGGRDRAIRADSNIWQIIESLKMIAALPLEGMYPSSARTRLKPESDLKSKIGYLEGTGEEIINLANQGYGLEEISHKIFGGPMWIEFITLGHFSRRCLTRSYLENKLVR